MIATIATITRHTVGGSSYTILNANPARKKVVIFNEGNDMYIAFGNSTTFTNYTYYLKSNETLEFSTYIEIVTAVSSGSSTVQVTEIE